MAETQTKREALPGDEFLEELEQIREQVTGGRPLRDRQLPRSFEEAVQARRTAGAAGIGLPKSNMERGLRVPDPDTRRAQLRKTIDEAGQDIFGGECPAHSELDRIVSRAFGVSDEEIERAAREEPSPEGLVTSGWYVWMLREGPWPFGIGTALVGEGEKLNPRRREMTLRHMDALRELYESWGMQNIQNATIRDDVHAEADVEHSNLDCNTIRSSIDTAELQEGFRRAFTLRIHATQQPTRI